MKLMERRLIAADKQPICCPIAPVAQHSAGYVIAPAKDRLTFGMSVNFKAGCCIDKVKTGRTGGCCSGIPNEKFIEHYRTSVQKELQTTGQKPKLDPDVQAILDGKPIPSKVEPAPIKTKNKPAQSPLPEAIWQRILLAPTRF